MCMILCGVVGCGENPVRIPAGEPARFMISGVDQCTSSGGAVTVPIAFTLVDYDDAPVTGRTVDVAIDHATFGTNSVRRTNAITNSDGQVILTNIRADSIPLSEGASRMITITARVVERPTVVVRTGILVEQATWLHILEPSMSVVCTSAVAGQGIDIDVRINVATACGATSAGDYRVDILANDGGPGSGVFQPRGSIDLALTNQDRIRLIVRDYDVQVIFRERDGRTPNVPSFVLRRC